MLTLIDPNAAPATVAFGDLPQGSVFALTGSPQLRLLKTDGGGCTAVSLDTGKCWGGDIADSTTQVCPFPGAGYSD